MRAPERLRSTDAPRVRDQKINQLIDFCKSLVVRTGSGVHVQQAAGGTTVSVRERGGRVRAGVQGVDCSGGDEMALGCVIGTLDADEWDRTSGKRPVVSVLTDIGWDPTGGNIVGRIRTLHFDRCGKLEHVSGEGDWLVLVPTESCGT